MAWGLIVGAGRPCERIDRRGYTLYNNPSDVNTIECQVTSSFVICLNYPRNSNILTLLFSAQWNCCIKVNYSNEISTKTLLSTFRKIVLGFSALTGRTAVNQFEMLADVSQI